MGKNFSMNNMGQRKKSDFYETPYSITQQFLDSTSTLWNNEFSILEPACGNGAIVSVLQKNNFKVVQYDINIGKDFLKETNQYHYIITNPPFSLAFEFIQKAKEIAMDRFAFLLPLSYLHGKKRYDYIYNDTIFPLSRVYVYTRYPLLGESLREDGKYKTGMMVYAWFIWDKTHKGSPTIHWIDNNDYVLNGKDT